MDTLKYFRIDPDGPGLTKVHSMDIAYDVHASETVALLPGEVYKIRTNIKIIVPEGTYGRLAERSGLASRGISLGGGVIDPNYTGEIMCLISSIKEYTINRNDKIAQLILEKARICPLEEIFSPPEAVDERGDQGFGSTGK
jgi:dUTP pyrophosphatase